MSFPRRRESRLKLPYNITNGLDPRFHGDDKQQIMKLIKNIVFIFLLLFLFSSLLENLFGYKSKLDFYRQFKNNFDKETKRNIELKTEVVRKKSTEEIEKKIRNNLNLLKDNEVALIIPSPPKTLISITPTPLPNWQQWWELYFGKN